MRTPKQIAASRANGARSKGPVTARGKRNSSRNSTRHGLLAESVVLKEEDKPRFLSELNELIAEHQPATPTQFTLVETIHVANWRRSRIWGMQKENFDHDVESCDVDTDSPALCAVLALRSSPDSIRSHELLLRYEVAFDRQASRALHRLQKLKESAQRGTRSAGDENDRGPLRCARVPKESAQRGTRSVGDENDRGPLRCARVPLEKRATRNSEQVTAVNETEVHPTKRTQQTIENTPAETHMPNVARAAKPAEPRVISAFPEIQTVTNRAKSLPPQSVQPLPTNRDPES